jgi:hypothetical protein
MNRSTLLLLGLLGFLGVGYLSLVSRPAADRILEPQAMEVEAADGSGAVEADRFEAFDTSYPSRTVTAVREAMHQVTVYAADGGDLAHVSMTAMGYVADAEGRHPGPDGSTVRVADANAREVLVEGVSPEGHVVRGVVRPGEGSTFTVRDASGRSMPRPLNG